jgi:4a-hydroxytetrahydrobiopterin dehydratase
VSALVYSYRETANGETKMTTELVNRRCKPCEGGVEPLRSEQVEQLMLALHSDWIASDDGVAISRQFDFPAYSRTLAFANAVAWIAICEGHHPVLTVSYGSCGVSYTTHSIGGLSDNDFICAAKIDRLAADS